MSTEDNEHDELLRAYRNKSQAQAGAPSQQTRVAILAGARAEALKRRPAANDSRYAWSAAAGVAVLGIALLLWRQADPQLPTGAAPPMATQAPVAEVAQADSLEAQELRIAPTGPAERIETAEQEVPRTSPTVVARAPEPPLRPGKATDAREIGEAISSAPAAGFAEADVAAPAEPDAQLLRDRFPEAWASQTPPATVWIIEDAQGKPLRQGTLAAGEPLPSLRPAVVSPAARAVTGVSAEAQSAPAADSVSLTMPQPGWMLRTTVNGAGVPVSIATARE